MSRPAFDKSELEPTGELYPKSPIFFGRAIPPEPIINRPIPPRENIRLALAGKKPYWIPSAGWTLCDVQQFRPRICPDTVATHGTFDGGEDIDFETLGNPIRSAWFDLDWLWEPTISGATVKPGNPKVKDINHWEDYVSIPDLDAMDWDSMVAENVEYLATDKLQQLGISSGLWERLISLLDAVEAALALYEDDSKPGVHRFLDRFSDFLIDYIGRVADRVPIHAVMLHEDWAHQNGPFFSMETAREMIVPYLKKITDYCHSRDIFFEIHMCGECSKIVPVMIEAGCDMWCGQGNLNDRLGLAKKYKDSDFVFGISYPVVPQDADDETLRALARDFVEEVKDLHVAITAFGPIPKAFSDAVYEYARLAYIDEPEIEVAAFQA